MITKVKTKINCYTFNLPPEISCPYSTPMCRAKCYGKAGYLQVENIQNRWRENLEETRKNTFRDKLADEIIAVNPKYFRFTSIGDVPNKSVYYDFMFSAMDNPATKFLLLTKSYPFMWRTNEIPKNLSQKFSVFPDTPLDNIFDMWNFPMAYAGSENNYTFHPGVIQTRVKNAFKCPSDCEKCNRICWERRDDVIFAFHGQRKNYKRGW